MNKVVINSLGIKISRGNIVRITLKTTESDKIKTGQTKLDKMSNFVMSNAGMMLDNKYEI